MRTLAHLEDIDPKLLPDFNLKLRQVEDRAANLTHNLRLPTNASPELRTLIVLGRCATLLKTEKRWNNRQISKPESVADHVTGGLIRLLLLAALRKLDVLHVLKMFLVHDLPEILTEDIIIYHYPVEDQPKIKKMKQVLEQIAMKYIAEAVGGELGQELLNLWLEYEQKATPAAILTSEVDKFEAVEQAQEYSTVPGNSVPMGSVFDNVDQLITDPLLREMLGYMRMISAQDEPEVTQKTA